MGEYRERMRRDLEIRGYSEKTRNLYLRAMTGLVRYYMRSPDQLTVEDINRYQHHLVEERGLSYSSFNIAVSAMRFFYKHTLPVTWSLERIPYRRKPKRLPVILSREGVLRLFAALANQKHRLILMTIYAGGLRLGDAVHLRVDDLDRERMLMRIRRGKGAKDRYVPLSATLLELLDAYCGVEHPDTWLFPGAKPGCPLHPRSIERLIEKAREKADIGKEVSIHSLRHAFATHMLEDGAHVRAVQAILGHKSLSTTAIYIHCTEPYMRDLRSPLDRLPTDELPPVG